MKDIIFANPNILDFASSLFLGNDDLRPAMKKHGVLGDYVYATCGHTCIRFKKDLTEMSEVYAKNENYPNAEAVFKIEDTNKETKFKLNDLLETFYKFKLKSETYLEECEHCEGQGINECQCCGHEKECEECDGDGGYEKKKEFGSVSFDIDDFAYMNLEGKKFTPNLLYRVIHTALILGQDTITMKYGDNHNCYFIIDNVEILIISRM